MFDPFFQKAKGLPGGYRKMIPSETPILLA